MSLQITIVEAQNLPRTDEGGRGKIDPYFRVIFGKQEYTTKAFLNDLNPKFNETFTFKDSPKRDQLVFELYDDDQNGTSKLISTYSVGSDELPTGRATIPLTQATGAACGNLIVEIVHIAPVVQAVVQPVIQTVVQPVVAAKSLQITIIEAKNLPVLSSGGGKRGGKTDVIDPFFKVTFGSQLYQTKIFTDTQNPRYNETFTFQDSPKRDKVIFELYNNDGGAGQLIATYVLDSDKIPTGRATLPLQTPQGVACGQLDIEVVHLETPVANTVVVQQPGPGGAGRGPVVVQAGPTVVQAGPSASRTVVVQQAAPQNVVVVQGGGRRK